MDYLSTDYTIKDWISDESEKDVIKLCFAIRMKDNPNIYLINEYKAMKIFKHPHQAERAAEIISKRLNVSLRVVSFTLVEKGFSFNVNVPCDSGTQECFAS